MGMKTTIAIDEETRDRLKKHGSMGDSFDTVINRVIDAYEERKEESKDA